MEFLPDNYAFPDLYTIKRWIAKRRTTHSGSMYNQMSCLNHGLMFYFG